MLMACSPQSQSRSDPNPNLNPDLNLNLDINDVTVIWDLDDDPRSRSAADTAMECYSPRTRRIAAQHQQARAGTLTVGAK